MKKITAILISLCMLITIMPGPAVFADAAEENGGTGDVCSLLVFGDSTTTGYGMPDQLRENEAFAIGNSDLEGSWTYEKAVAYNEDPSHSKRGRLSNDSYPWQLKKYIESLDSVSRCDLSSMCLNALLSDSLRAMLDPAYYERETEQEARIMDGKGPVTDQIKMYEDDLYNGGAITEKTYAALHDYTVTQVKNADVIVLDANTNNIANYLFRRLSGPLGVPFMGGEDYYKEGLSNLDELPDKHRAALKVIREELMDVVGKTDDPLIGSMIESVMYCYADCVINFSENIKLIRTLNPDAKIIVPALYNGIAGITVYLGDKTINVEAMYGILVQAVNTYIRALDENSPNYYIADVPVRLHTINDEFMEAESADELINSRYGQAYLDTLYYKFGDLLCPGGNKEQNEEKIRKLFVEGIINYPIDLGVIINGLDMRASIMEIQTYFQTGEMPSAGTMTLMHIMSALLLVHPSKTGGYQKLEAVKAALSKEDTAYEETLQNVVSALRDAAAKAGIKDLSDLQKIIALTDMTSGVSLQDLLAVGQAVYGLPEFEKMISSYMDAENAKSAEAEDRIETLEAQILELNKKIEELSKEKEEKKVKLAKARITSIRPASKALTVKWKKVSNAGGYKVSFKAPGKKAVVKTVKGGSKLSLKLTGLKKKTKYTVKVRAWKKAGGKTYYGSWSATKKVSTK